MATDPLHLQGHLASKCYPLIPNGLITHWPNDKMVESGYDKSNLLSFWSWHNPEDSFKPQPSRRQNNLAREQT